MKNTLQSTITLLIASASSAFASNSSDSAGGLSIMTILFLGFFGLIIATQVLPGLFLFLTGTKSVFGKRNSGIVTKR